MNKFILQLTGMTAVCMKGYVWFVMRVNKRFMAKTVKELEELSAKETQLITGLARLTAFVAAEGDTAKDTVQKFYPQMKPPLREKVAVDR